MMVLSSAAVDSPLMALSSTKVGTTLHTTTSPRISQSSSSFDVAALYYSITHTIPKSTTTALNHVTGAYTPLSTEATTALNHLTGAYTGASNTESVDTGIYTIVTENGGICRMSMTDTSTPAYATYVPGTTVAPLDRRASAPVMTQGSNPPATPAGGLPVGTTDVPASDIPVCALATASGAFSSPDNNPMSGATSSVQKTDSGLNTGQKAGVAVGVVVAVVAIICAVIYYMHKKGTWANRTQAQSNIWGPANTVGGTNADVGMREGGQMVSGVGLREVLFDGRRTGFR